VLNKNCIICFLNKSYIKFIIVSLLNTIFGLGVFYLLIFIKIPFQFASFLGTLIGVIFNYNTTGRIVFSSSRNIKTIFKYILVYIIVYLFNILFLSIFVKMKVNLYYGGLILILPSGILSFILNKYFVFTNNKLNHEKN
jgi:putative flippase GtrA